MEEGVLYQGIRRNVKPCAVFFEESQFKIDFVAENR
jgi:hypothetical protein